MIDDKTLDLQAAKAAGVGKDANSTKRFIGR
jgi:hypothetical protein